MSYLAICLSTRHHFAGTCKNGTGKVGCGHQEEFRACSDVVITEEDGTVKECVEKEEIREEYRYIVSDFVLDP